MTTINLAETVEVGSEELGYRHEGRYLLEIKGKSNACKNMWSIPLNAGDDISDLNDLAAKKLNLDLNTHRTIASVRIWDRMTRAHV